MSSIWMHEQHIHIYVYIYIAVLQSGFIKMFAVVKPMLLASKFPKIKNTCSLCIIKSTFKVSVISFAFFVGHHPLRFTRTFHMEPSLVST